MSPPSADIPLWLVTPFALLLLLIAAAPLAPARARHWWERYYPHVSIVLGLSIVLHYLARIPGGADVVLHTAHEYLSFITLIGALFVVAGGIHVEIKGDASPLTNVAFLATGAVLANVLGTTGASVLLIRPWLRLNRGRVAPYHVAFFIFIVSNIGGALTPIGDPPLFLGYLRGVPFFWLFGRVLAPWLVTLGLLLAVFYLIDRRSVRQCPRDREVSPDPWRFDGTINVLLLLVVIGAVFLPERFFAREAVMLAAASASHWFTPRRVRTANVFTFAPLKEVIFLFAGIFATMMPALDYLAHHGAAFGLVQPREYYVATGMLSAVLDNAPTYANFLQLAQASTGNGASVSVATLLAARPALVVAISLGAVFFGAMTYIGNGPNFMVRAIALEAGVRVPSFGGFVLKYSLPILLPILVFTGIVFL